ncbi:MAG: hypothetical protein JRF70_01540 [Deltaproteobacteria bacterium]|nr:hypothetical protein [Deltaproteobacteria bacterium]
MSCKNVVSSALALVAVLGFGIGTQAMTSSVGGPERDAFDRPLVLRESPRSDVTKSAFECLDGTLADGIIDFLSAAPAFGFPLDVLGEDEANGALHLGGNAGLLSWQTLVGLGSLDRAGANEILPIGIEDLGFTGVESLTVSLLASGALDRHELEENFRGARDPGTARLRNARRWNGAGFEKRRTH